MPCGEGKDRVGMVGHDDPRNLVIPPAIEMHEGLTDNPGARRITQGTISMTRIKVTLDAGGEESVILSFPVDAQGLRVFFQPDFTIRFQLTDQMCGQRIRQPERHVVNRLALLPVRQAIGCLTDFVTRIVESKVHERRGALQRAFRGFARRSGERRSFLLAPPEERNVVRIVIKVAARESVRGEGNVDDRLSVRVRRLKAWWRGEARRKVAHRPLDGGLPVVTEACGGQIPSRAGMTNLSNRRHSRTETPTPWKTMNNLILNMRPDAVDLRDRIYSPTLRELPPRHNNSPFDNEEWARRIKDQKKTSACTGYALSGMIEILLETTGRLDGLAASPADGRISPFMPYYFARRYDEIPGDSDADEGSTARAAMKAWSKHGAAGRESWPAIGYPTGRDWIEDAFRRPLGAYFRVDHTSITDMHAAINETGALYVAGAVHAGWQDPRADGTISFSKSEASTGGHAFLIVGYDESGFWIQNSWGKSWGKKGFAHLTYGDWNANGWDAWVAQAGVQISSYIDTLSSGLSLSNASQQAAPEKLLSSNEAIRAQQLNPFIINLENNGTLSPKGSYSTTPEDLNLLITHYIPSAVKDFKIKDGDPIDIAIYAHGGLTPEKGAAETAAKWLPALYHEKVFPLFIMWETGAVDTIGSILSDAFNRHRTAVGSPLDWLADHVDDRLETAVSGIGTTFWDEMKENAAEATLNRNGGLHQLFTVLTKSGKDLMPRLRIHLIGHSAGAVFHAHLLPALLKAKLAVDGVYFMAPAARMDLFESHILPHYKSGKVACYTQFHLSDKDEQSDWCGELLNVKIYNKSLLYLVSNAFERKRGTPLLGMEKFVSPAVRKNPNPQDVEVWDWIPSRSGAKVPNAASSSQHGGFGEDDDAIASIVTRIANR